MSKRYPKKQNQTVLEIVFLGIFKAIWFLIKLPFGKGKKKGLAQSDINFIQEKKSEVSEMLKSTNEYELKHAVIEADKLVDFILRSIGYEGDTFAERMQSARGKINPGVYESLWAGHKVRNQIAHESEARLSSRELKEAADHLLKYVRNF